MTARFLSPSSAGFCCHSSRIIVVAEPYDAQADHASRGVHVPPFSWERAATRAHAHHGFVVSDRQSHPINVLRSGAGQMTKNATGSSRTGARTRTTDSRFGSTPRSSTPYAVDTLMSSEEVVGNSIPFKKQRGFSAVYFLINAGEIIYVGQTVDLQHRIATHAKSKEFDSYGYILVPGDQLSSAEADYIVKFKPRLNSQMPLGGRYISEKEARRRVHFADLRRAVASGRLARHALSFGAYFVSSEVDALAEEVS